MSENFSFSWSFSLPQAPPPADLWAFDECFEYPLPQGNLLLANRRNGKRTVVTGEVLMALRHCKRFRSLDGHCRHLGQVLPNPRGQDAELKRILQLVREAGFLASANELIERLWQPAPTPARPAEVVACVTTCDRPGPLRRLLERLPPSEEKTPRLRYWVIDDSRQPESRQRNQGIVTEIAGRGRCAIGYFGIAEQQRMIEQLVDRLPEREAAIRFLLEPSPDSDIVSHGRTRNLGLLLSVGQPLLFLDDDILPQVFTPPVPALSTKISSSPREAVFFSSNEEWGRYQAPEGLDPLRRHAEFLGLSLQQALPKVAEKSQGHEALAELTAAERLELRPDSPILVTACGAYGDPGIANNYWLFNLDGPSLDRLIASEAGYRRGLSERNLWLGRAGYQFVPNIALLSQLTGLDNGALLPPYFPFFRNEDFLFGFMTQLLHPDVVLLDLPWAITHLPDPPRRWEINAVDQIAYSGILSFTAEALFGQRRQWTSAETRLIAIAAQLRDYAAMPAEELRRWFTNHVLQTRIGRINRWQQLLEQRPDGPDYWRQDLLRGIQINQDSLIGATGPLLKDIPEDIEAAHIPGYLASLWRRFADALETWPDIRAAARTLKI